MNHNQTHLYIGQTPACLQEIAKLVSEKNNSKTVSADDIISGTHPWIQLVQPPYTIALVDELLEQTRYTLEHNEFRVFIFLGAHHLNQASANRMLKQVEEPHAGYYFFFCTQTPHLMLATIRSRCMIHQVYSEQNMQQLPPCLQPFVTLQVHHPVDFSKQIEASKMKETETYQAYEWLLEHWKNQYKKIVLANPQNTEQKKVEAIIDVLLSSAAKLPMPGSSKLFWKQLYVAFSGIIQNQ
ncbi:hypothetical protein EBR77_01640 [bacterium]|jgi:hypothetical protein|nr:hypothetical protein [bacterium]NBX78525.1 hypothetical protein [bacterium]